MSELPVPKSKSGWTIAVLYTLILFLIYYLGVFENLLEYYNKQHHEIPYRSQQNLKIVVKAPKQLYDAEPSWLYISVTNNKDKAIYDVNIDVNMTSNNAVLILPSLYGEDIYGTDLKFKVIEAHATAMGRTRIIAQENLSLGSVFLSFADGQSEISNKPFEFKPAVTVPPLKSDPNAGLRRSFVAAILLPPWSNTFIFALVLFSVYLAEGAHKNKIIQVISARGVEGLLIYSILISCVPFLLVIIFLTVPLGWFTFIILGLFYIFRSLMKRFR
jgi:hypothetical protein